MSDLASLLSAVRKLSPSELDRLSQEIMVARQFAHTNSEPGSHGAVIPDEGLMLGMICDYCKLNALDFRTPERMRASPLHKQFKEKAPAVMGYMRSFCRTRLQLRAVLYLVFDEMRAEGGPINAVMLMSRVHLVPSTIDRMFPGYLRSGLLPMIAKRITNEKPLPGKAG